MNVKNKIRIIISRPDRLGDVVLSTSMPRLIKEHIPNAYVAVLLRKYTEAIYINNPYVDKKIIFEPESSDFKSEYALIKQLREIEFDYSFSLLPNPVINKIFFISGIKYRIGVGHKLYQFLTNTKSVYRRKHEQSRNEADYCLDFLRKLGIPVSTLSSEIYLTEEEKEQCKNIKRKLAPDGEFIVGLQISSGKSSPNLSQFVYKELFDSLSCLSGIKVVFTDDIMPIEFPSRYEKYFINKSIPLRESFAGYKAVDLLISSSTGPMHFSAALGVKTLSVFCPLPACEPKLWGPVGNKAEFILPDKEYCSSQCSGDPKLCDFSGEGGINIQKIVFFIQKIIAHRNDEESV